jgi:hypothetical protein
MDIAWFVGKLLEQDDVDALREGVRVLAKAVMETEVSSQIGAAPLRTQHRAPGLSERLSHEALGHARRHDRAEDSEGHLRCLLPEPPRAPPACGEGAARGGGRGLRERRLDPQGRQISPCPRLRGPRPAARLGSSLWGLRRSTQVSTIRQRRPDPSNRHQGTDARVRPRVHLSATRDR